MVNATAQPARRHHHRLVGTATGTGAGERLQSGPNVPIERAAPCVRGKLALTGQAIRVTLPDQADSMSESVMED